MSDRAPTAMQHDGDRRATGVYYTPPRLAAALVKWAVRPGSRRILDPAFGDGALLEAAVARLRTERVRRPGRRMWGMELDPDGPARVARKRLGIPAQQLRVGDFLAHDLVDFPGGPFDTIVGNPPYVRHHLLNPTTRAWGRQRAAESGIALNDRSDAWAYFCAHLMGFLSPAGRLGLLLPGSVLHADYALPLVHALGAGSGHTHLIRVQRLQFADVLERTVVLLVDHAAPGDGEVEYREVADLAALERFLDSGALTRARRRRAPAEDAGLRHDTRLATRLRWHLESAEVEAFQQACRHPHVTALGDIASVRIGVVTGANSWFVRTGLDVEALGVDHLPIVARAVWLRRPVWRTSDEQRVWERRSRLLALDADTALSITMRREIAAGMKDQLHRRHHCANRTPWWALRDRRVPQLFLPYMGVRAPGLILNAGEATCTNTIHRVWLKPTAPAAAALVLGSWTSLWRLGAELHGRSYGGGVLKLEPGETTHVPIPLLPCDPGDTLVRLEDCWRRDGEAAARELADRLVLDEALGLAPADIATIRAAALRLEARRAS